MNTMPSPKPSEFFAASLRAKSSVEAPPIRPADVKTDQASQGDAPPWRQALRAADLKSDQVPQGDAPSWRQALRAADLKDDQVQQEDAPSWQQADRSAAPANDQSPRLRSRLGKLAPFAFARYLMVFFIGAGATVAWQTYGDEAREMIAPAAALSADQQRFNALWLDLDAVRQSIDRVATSVATSQEQITHSVDQLAAGQEQMTHEISKLQAIEQYVLYKNPEPAVRPATPTSKPVWRPSMVPVAR
jgi:hypothetical protein